MKNILECKWRHASHGTSTFPLDRLMLASGIAFVVKHEGDRNELKAYLLIHGCDILVVDSFDDVPFNKIPMVPMH